MAEMYETETYGMRNMTITGRTTGPLHCPPSLQAVHSLQQCPLGSLVSINRVLERSDVLRDHQR